MKCINTDSSQQHKVKQKQKQKQLAEGLMLGSCLCSLRTSKTIFCIFKEYTYRSTELKESGNPKCQCLGCLCEGI